MCVYMYIYEFVMHDILIMMIILKTILKLAMVMVIVININYLVFKLLPRVALIIEGREQTLVDQMSVKYNVME